MATAEERSRAQTLRQKYASHRPPPGVPTITYEALCAQAERAALSAERKLARQRAYARQRKLAPTLTDDQAIA